MKKIMFAGLALAAAMTACNSDNNSVTLNGTTDLADGEVLILSYRLNPDSTVIGQFQLFSDCFCGSIFPQIRPIIRTR